MICPICGADLGDSAFCDNCGTIVNAETGADLETVEEAGAETKPKKHTAIAVAIVAAVIVVLAIAVASFWPKQSDNDNSHLSDQASTASEDAVSQSSENTSASSASSSTSGSSASGAANSTSLSSSRSSASTQIFDPADLDSIGNPTLFALTELSGSELQSLLSYAGFIWYDQASSWLASDGKTLSVLNASGNLSRRDIDRISDGAEGKAVIYFLAVNGYASPGDAFDALAENIVVEDEFENDEALFAVVSTSKGNRYIAVVTTTNTNEQTLLLYPESAVEQNLFRDTIGVDAGETIDEAWETITR